MEKEAPQNGAFLFLVTRIIESENITLFPLG